MPILSVYVTDRTLQTLRHWSDQLGRTVEDLAEAAIEEEALKAEDKIRGQTSEKDTF